MTRWARSSAITKATSSRSKATEPFSQDRTHNISLTGYMAVGKSAVGRTLARKLKLRCVDLDKVIEKAEGMKVRDIFEQKGEAYFRQREKETLAQVLERSGQIIATGGGVIVDEENLRLLRAKALLICLTASTEVLLKRAGGGAKRPLLPKERKAALDAWEDAESLALKDAAGLRRKHIKHHRLAELAQRPDIVAQDIARARAIRHSMEKRINE